MTAAAISPDPTTPRREQIRAFQQALEEVRLFLARVHTTPDVGITYEQHVSVLHATDHMDRMARALGDPPPASACAALARRKPIVLRASAVISESVDLLRTDAGQAVGHLAELAGELAAERQRGRPKILAETASGQRPPNEAMAELDAMRWVDRLGYHLWRAADHLALVRTEDTTAE